MSRLTCIGAMILNIVIAGAQAGEDCSPVAAVEDFYTQGWGS